MTPARPNPWFGCKGWLRAAALAAAWFAATMCAWGAEKSVLPEFLIRGWDSADGLPAARVSATAQTDDGYLWVGTGRGLARFDGTRFVVLTTNNTPALGDDRITSLLVSRSGDLWVGTEGGFLSRRHGGVFARIGLEERFCTNRISALAEEGESVVWVGTRGAGLARWSPGACEWFSVGKTTNAVDNEVTQVAADRTGRLWAVASGNLVAFSGGAWHQVAEGPLAELRPKVTALTPARDGGVWIAACPPQLLQGRGTQLFRYDSHGWTSLLAPYPWRQDSIFTSTARLIEDEAGRVWVATVGAGIFVWSAETGWQPLISSSESPLAECSSLAEGKEGVIWVGTTDFLLFQIRDRPVRTLQLPEAASQHVVLGACARADGSVWVGTDGQGTYRFRQGVCEPAVFAPDLGELQSHVAVLYEDPQTSLWAGTWAGLHHLEGGQFRPVTDFGPLTNVVLTLRTDSRSNLWAGTSAGVVRYGPDGTNLFAQAQGIDHFYIRAIEEDRAGQIWVAVTDRGLYRKTGERFEHFGAGQWVGENRIRELHADSNGALWITTDGLGLACLRDGKFAEWTSEDGLPTDNLVAVTEDDKGNLWFSSANGIFGCPKSRLLAYQRGISPSILFWQVSSDEGLHTRRCSGAGQPVIGRSADGRLWVPNWHALAVFDPLKLQHDLAVRPLPPILEEVLVEGVPLALDAAGRLRISSSTRSLEFHFTSPALHAPERLRFRYRLAGLERDWVDAGSRRTAYYAYLPIGHYEFQVTAGGPDGVWQESQQNLQLEVVPRFWQRRPVQLLAAVVILTGVGTTVWSVSRNRLRRRLARLERARALDEERSRIARDMHDEIGARLTQISLLSALADGSASDEAEVRTHTAKISGVARGLTRSLDEIVWAVRPQNDNLESLVDYLDESLRDLCTDSKVRYWFAGPSAVPAIEVAANARHNLLLACTEAVNNTLKYSGASEVRVSARLENGTMTVEIADNGRGFNVAEGEAKQSGLLHMRQRLGEVGGNCEISSSSGQGTRIRFALPLGSGSRDGLGNQNAGVT